MKEIKFCILKNEDPESHYEWETACKKQNAKYDIVELKSNKWFEGVIKENYDCYLLKPPGNRSEYKTLYDERIYILSKVLNKFVYPSYEELIIHENKRMLSYFVEAKNIPHNRTDVFYNKKECMDFAKSTEYPIVAKTSIGAGGDGVAFLNSYDESLNYINEAFSTGISRKTGPGLRQGNYLKRAAKWIRNPKYAIKKLKGYHESSKEIQKNFVLFQEFIPHDYEWRTAKIGDSYFAHKKIKAGMMCSGSKGIDYVNPPIELLNFTKKICEDNHFNCMSLDILEGNNGEYLINEMQTIFGHIQDHILEVDGKPGRYLHKEGNWIFEEGSFNSNLSFDLRLRNVIQLIG